MTVIIQFDPQDRHPVVISTDEKIHMLLTDLVKARDIALAVQKQICQPWFDLNAAAMI